MIVEISNFITFLHQVRKSSPNTELSYEKDLLQMADFLEEQGITDVRTVTEESLNDYVQSLSDAGRAPATIARKIASIRAFFSFVQAQEEIFRNPAEHLAAPHMDKTPPEILSPSEVDRLLQAPLPDSPKGIRDRAMLQLLYATGIRVSELISLAISDINLKDRMICSPIRGKERRLPFDAPVYDALSDYLAFGRPAYVRGSGTEILFLNHSGEPFSRQGFWKLIKNYSSEAGIEKDITPTTLRHSFAVHQIAAGTDVGIVQKRLGHIDNATTKMYVGLARQEAEKC